MDLSCPVRMWPPGGATSRFDVARVVYDDIRATPNRFLLKAGHQIDDIDEIVGSHDGYVIAERRVSEAES